MPSLRRLLPLTFCLCLTACANEEPESDFNDQLPLLSAAEQGDLPGISRLIAESPEVDIRDACLWTPLMKAALNGHPEAVRQLLEAGAEVNLTDKGGYSALMLAASNNHAAIIDMLLAAGANPNQVEQTGGFDALIWAAQLGHSAAVERLLASPVDRSRRDSEGKSAEDWARENGHQQVLRLLGGD